MENYPSNSLKSREKSAEEPTKKTINKVVVGNVRTEKKGGLRKFLSAFISDDISDVKSYVWYNVIVPAVKRTLSDAVDVALNGETSKKNRYTSSMGSYRGGYSKDVPEKRFDIRNLYEIDDIILESYGDAEMILDEMNAAIDKYGLVSVSDLYDMLGKSNGSHTDCKYGWNSLRTARIVPVRNGFALRLPRVIPLN